MSEKQDLISGIKRFSEKGWMPGAIGAAALINCISEDNYKIHITCNQPSKGFYEDNDIYLLRKVYENYDIVNPLNEKDDQLTISSWTNSFLEIVSKHPEVRCIVQVCPKWPVIAGRMSLLAWQKTSESSPNILRLAHWKLLEKFSSKYEILIPIINYDDIAVMFNSIKDCLFYYPEAPAIIIRDYGIIVWGNSLRDTENKVEILNYLCELQILDYKLRTTGL